MTCHFTSRNVLRKACMLGACHRRLSVGWNSRFVVVSKFTNRFCEKRTLPDDGKTMIGFGMKNHITSGSHTVTSLLSQHVVEQLQPCFHPFATTMAKQKGGKPTQNAKKEKASRSKPPAKLTTATSKARNEWSMGGQTAGVALCVDLDIR